MKSKLYDEMKALVERNVEFYHSDFDFDINILSHAEKDELFLWTLRKCGTHLVPLHDAFIAGTAAYMTATYYQGEEILFCAVVKIEEPGDNWNGKLKEYKYSKMLDLLKNEGIKKCDYFYEWKNGVKTVCKEMDGWKRDAYILACIPRDEMGYVLYPSKEKYVLSEIDEIRLKRLFETLC